MGEFMKLALKAKDRGPDRSFASSLDIINFGELPILSNADMLKSRVRNYARAAEAHVSFERRGIRFAQTSPRG